MTATVKKPQKSHPVPARKAGSKTQATRPAKDAAAKAPSAPKHPAPTTGSQPAIPKTTKQERVLALLSRADGASIDEIIKATDWQQHSVRGFFAGTVKKKLGFMLLSTKDHDKPRRYRIDRRRGQ